MKRIAKNKYMENKSRKKRSENLSLNKTVHKLYIRVVYRKERELDKETCGWVDSRTDLGTLTFTQLN